jgi:hypothetical protein
VLGLGIPSSVNVEVLGCFRKPFSVFCCFEGLGPKPSSVFRCFVLGLGIPSSMDVELLGRLRKPSSVFCCFEGLGPKPSSAFRCFEGLGLQSIWETSSVFSCPSSI